MAALSSNSALERAPGRTQAIAGWPVGNCSAAALSGTANSAQTVSIAAPETTVVDTTGAGDAMVGAYAAAVDRGAPLRRALAEGVAAGSLACTGLGAQGALPVQSAIAALAATL